MIQQYAKCPVPLARGEVMRYRFPNVALVEPRIVGTVQAEVMAPTTMTVNGQAVQVMARVAQTMPQVAEIIMGVGLLVITNTRLVFVSESYGLSVAFADVLGYAGTEDEVTVVRNGQTPLKLICEAGKGIGRGLVR